NTKAPIIALVAASYLGGPSAEQVGRDRGRRLVTLACMATAGLILFSTINGARDVQRTTRVSSAQALWQTGTQLFSDPGDFGGASVRRVLIRLDGLQAAS